MHRVGALKTEQRAKGHEVGSQARVLFPGAILTLVK